MKRLLSMLLTAAIVLTLIVAAVPVSSNAEGFDYFELKEVPFDETKKNYAEVLEAEYHNHRILRDIPMAYETESWNAYYNASRSIRAITPDKVTADNFPTVQRAIDARKALKQIKPIEECVWMLWDKSMPSNVDTAKLVYDYTTWDNEGFLPYLMPYMLEDQTKVKGNIIVVAGGGYEARMDNVEGFPVAERFNALGYNCFILQRRVEPYTPEDAWMDLQRAIRYIRYYADEKKIAATDCLCAVGFSGGGFTISGTICYAYGDVQPTVFDANYKSDDIDKLSSDLDVALLIYGPVTGHDDIKPDGTTDGWKTKNTKLPYVFITAGYADSQVSPALNVNIAEFLVGKTVVELHMMAGAGHGYGVKDDPDTNIGYWPELADGFIDLAMAAKAEAAEEAGNP